MESLLALSWTWHVVGDDVTATRILQHALQDSLGVGYRKDYQLSHLADLLGWLLAAGRSHVDDATAVQWVAHLAGVIEDSVRGAESRPADVAAQTLIARAFEWRPSLGVALAQHFADPPGGWGSIGWEPLVTLNLLQSAVQDDTGAIPLAADILVHHILPRRHGDRGLSDAYPSFTEALIRACPPERAATVAAELCERIDALATRGVLASNPDAWKRGVGTGLRAVGLGAVADALHIPAETPPPNTFAEDDAVLGSGSPDGKTTWAGLIDRVTERGLTALLEEAYTPDEVSVWAHLIATQASEITQDDLQATASFVSAHPELARTEVQEALYRSLSAFGLRGEAWVFGESLLDDVRRAYDPWSPESAGFRAATTLVEVDPDKARPLLLQALAYDAATRPANVFPWLSSILPLLEPSPTPVAHWEPVQAYLEGLAPDAGFDDLADVALPPARLSGEEGLLRYLLFVLTDAVSVYRCAPALLAELDRSPRLVATAVGEALQADDRVRRPLLQSLTRAAAADGARLTPLAEPVEAAIENLPEDLRHYAVSVRDAIRSATSQRP